jgi:hypothetical protein
VPSGGEIGRAKFQRHTACHHPKAPSDMLIPSRVHFNHAFMGPARLSPFLARASPPPHQTRNPGIVEDASVII